MNFVKICNEQMAKVLKRNVDNVTNDFMNKIEEMRREYEFALKKNELQKQFLKLKLAELD